MVSLPPAHARPPLPARFCLMPVVQAPRACTCRETAEEMLAGCGLPELEAGVMAFLGGRAAVLHLVALLDDQERLLAQVGGGGPGALHWHCEGEGRWWDRCQCAQQPGSWHLAAPLLRPPSSRPATPGPSSVPPTPPCLSGAQPDARLRRRAAPRRGRAAGADTGAGWAAGRHAGRVWGGVRRGGGAGGPGGGRGGFPPPLCMLSPVWGSSPAQAMCARACVRVDQAAGAGVGSGMPAWEPNNGHDL